MKVTGKKTEILAFEWHVSIKYRTLMTGDRWRDKIARARIHPYSLCKERRQMDG